MTEKVTTNFKNWLSGRKATEEELIKYLSHIGEWIRSEFKVTSNEDGTNIRKAVCALANSKGGELFIGIDDDRKIIGCNLTLQQIKQNLEQSNSKKDIWYISDLTEVIENIVPIELKNTNEKVTVYVLNVLCPGVPVFLFETNKFYLYKRCGESSIQMDVIDAFIWYKQISREEILRMCYLEYKYLSRRISYGFPQYTIGLGIKFPYLEKHMEDGTLFKYLTDDDILFLLGRGHGTGFEGGLYNDLFEMKCMIEHNTAKDYYPWLEEMRQKIQSVSNGMRNGVESFRNYLKKNKIQIPDEIDNK